MHPTDYSDIRGFNYQPSWGSTGLEIWRNFDAERFGHELALGRAYFPGINAIRLWLSYDAWARDPDRFAAHLETGLALAARLGLAVMPVLFNRWHSKVLDYGGVYIDHLRPGNWAYREDLYDDYVRQIVGAHASDARIFSWDLCNEPCPWGSQSVEHAALVRAEFGWLQRMHGLCKEVGAVAPITVGAYSSLEQHKHWEPLSDVISIHPYAMTPGSTPEKFEAYLDSCVALAASVKRPLLATETCWGAFDDDHRVEIVRYTLGELKKRNIGWLAYLLHHSLVADAHRPAFGPLDPAIGNLAFIEADGTLRPGHGVFNEF